MIQGGPETYFDRGLQQVECPVCFISLQHHSQQHHINYYNPD